MSHLNHQQYPQQMQFHPDQAPPEEGLTLRDYLQILNKRRLTVFTVFLIVFTISIILGLRQETPLYTSSSTILLERNIINSNSGLGTYYVWDPEFLPTQTEILKSKKVARRVIELLHLDTKYFSHFFPEKEKQNSWLTTLKQLPSTILTGLFPSDNSDDGTTTADPTAEDYKNIIADIIRSGIEVKPIKETRVVKILYTGTNPALTKLINDTFIEAYIEETIDIKLSSTQQSLKWMTTKAGQERKKLEEAEKNLQKYLRKYNLVTLENRLAIYPEKLSQFSYELSVAETKRKEIEDLYDQIAKIDDADTTIETIPYFANNANLQSLRDQILKAEQRIKELSKKYGPKHPSMIKAVDDRAILIREKGQAIGRVKESISKEYELARSQEENLRELLTSTKNELLDVNERFIQYSIMKREVDSSRALYEALTSSLKKAGVTKESQNVSIWVMRDASLPKTPSNQRSKQAMLIGFILAAAAGIGMALLVEYLDNTIKSAEDIENRYGLTVLGAIFETRKNEQIEKIIQIDGLSSTAESYRLIRSSLLLSSADHPPRTILITSMKAQEGKTSTSLNLARTMSQISDKILIIDADMRKPRLHSLLGVQNKTGLSSYLSGNIDEKIIRTSPTEKIHIIPSGPIPPNPVELISSQRMKTLLQEMQNQYDYIFIDSPPIIHLADGMILSTLVEGTVLVARAGKVTYDVFNAGLKKLNDFNPHILGVVLNAMNTRFIGSQSYYYYSYKSYYSDDYREKDNSRHDTP